MLQLTNKTPFETALFVFPDPQGVDTLYVVIKGTFDIHPQVRVAEKQFPIITADEYWGDPASSSLKLASEAHLSKPGTDVVVLGDAISPKNLPSRTLDVMLSVANRTKSYQVSGDRRWGGLVFKEPGTPEPFKRMPLIFERAFGGSCAPEKGGPVETHPMNPVGRGFKCKTPAKDYEQGLLPNIEDKQKPLKALKDAETQMPVGMGFVAPTWQPRKGFAGTYDEAWQKTRAPFLPTDFNPRYFQVAHPDWIFEPPLQGGESVQMVHLSEREQQVFALPRCTFGMQAVIQGQPVSLQPMLETVLLMPNHEQVALTWRAALPCDKRVLKIDEVRIQLDQMVLQP